MAEKQRWSYSSSLQGSKKIRLCLVQAGEKPESWGNVLSPWQPPKHRSQAMSRSSLIQRKCLPKDLSSNIPVFPGPPPTLALPPAGGPASCALLSQQVSTRALGSSWHFHPLHLPLHPEEFQIYSTPGLLLPNHKSSGFMYQMGEAYSLHFCHLNHCLADLKCVF